MAEPAYACTESERWDGKERLYGHSWKVLEQGITDPHLLRTLHQLEADVQNDARSSKDLAEDALLVTGCQDLKGLSVWAYRLRKGIVRERLRTVPRAVIEALKECREQMRPHWSSGHRMALLLLNEADRELQESPIAEIEPRSPGGAAGSGEGEG